MNTLPSLEDKKNELITLCKNFDLLGWAAEPNKIIADLLNVYLDTVKLKKMEIRNIVFTMTSLMVFISFLHEIVYKVNDFEKEIQNTQDPS